MDVWHSLAHWLSLRRSPRTSAPPKTVPPPSIASVSEALPPNGLQRTYPGKLIIVEGIDGSGKSTQLDLLRKWLMSQNYLVAFSEWNSSPMVNRITKRGKKTKALSPVSFSLIHAADFVDRLERQILPALEAGAIVLADRYVFTA